MPHSDIKSRLTEVHRSGWAESVQLSMVWRSSAPGLDGDIVSRASWWITISHTFLLEIRLPSAVTDAHVVTRATYAGWWSLDAQIQDDHL